ncbi:MAG: ribosome assembly RNA-binding protein YhbY [Defluviitaleaceae bacterium]|nr:ribosome assembly RNA-binding protein YhbY [Defluviitaleaceae bacterium]
MTTKQRAFLRALANKKTASFQIGKGGVTPEVVKAVDEYLEANELVKISVLENCDETVKETAEILSGRTRSDVVQVVGRKIVLFRVSKTKSVVELPK